MTYRVSYDICEAPIADADATAVFLAQRANLTATHGKRAQTFWFAPAGQDEDVLRVDLDFDEGRAAVRWLPDESYAVELAPAGPIVVMESSDCPPVNVPAEVARLSIDTAIAAAADYVRTGHRPTGLTWESASDD